MTISFRLFLLLVLCSWSCAPQNKSQSASKPAITNPVLARDFPDPTVIRANGRYYAYATQGGGSNGVLNIQVASSDDLQHWKTEGDALPQKPAWAHTTQDFWAPHVLYDAQTNKYILFYSGESDDTTSGKCLGVAFSDQPEGPFVDKGTPLICGEGFVNIDPMAFADPKTGKKWLYWGSAFQPIKVQEMASDWSSFKPGSTALPVVWPGKEMNYDKLIEGAWVDYHQGKYFLYFSGDNCCGDQANYAVMVARADSAQGPFIRYGASNGTGSSVVLEKDSLWLAPGHNSVFKDSSGKDWIAYHAISRADTVPGKGRVLCISRMRYVKGWPRVIKQ